eukprot:70407-Pleurochrysis_carterae.AAC.1
MHASSVWPNRLDATDCKPVPGKPMMATPMVERLVVRTTRRHRLQSSRHVAARVGRGAPELRRRPCFVHTRQRACRAAAVEHGAEDGGLVLGGQVPRRVREPAAPRTLELVLVRLHRHDGGREAARVVGHAHDRLVGRQAEPVEPDRRRDERDAVRHGEHVLGGDARAVEDRRGEDAKVLQLLLKLQVAQRAEQRHVAAHERVVERGAVDQVLRPAWTGEVQVTCHASTERRVHASSIAVA